MAEFVLVHGSGQNASCWSRVGGMLRARGHDVAAPDLPKRAPEWGLVEYAGAIAEAVAGPRAVVVAHSLSGAFLPLVPELRECGLLVFLAAVVPEPGKSVREQFTEDPSMFSPEWIEAGPRWLDPEQQESLGKEFLFHDCDAMTLAWGLTTLELLETRDLVIQRSPLAQWPRVPAASIVATEDRTLSPDWIRSVSRRVVGEEPIEMRAGHCPQISRAEETADLLERLAGQAIA